MLTPIYKRFCYSCNNINDDPMKYFALLLILFTPFFDFAQYCDSFELTLEDELEFGCTKNSITTLHDQLDRDFLYVANTGGGLSVVDLSDPENMTSVVNLPIDNFANIPVNRITQEGNYLYLALGTLFGSHGDPSGMAIVNIENPLSPTVLDVWTSEENAGCAYVAVRGHLAYLCALSNGVIVLNIADKENISFVSQYIPPTNWPEAVDPDKVKARHIVFEGDKAYVAYDAGGMRILDISNPSELNEIGRYSNPAMEGAARAYNNIVKEENLLYVAVDYAGMEVLDISNTTEVTLHGWWNPNDFPLANPAATSWKWFSSAYHTNEIHLIDECGVVFMSCGRTEIVGIDVSDPSAPTLCGHFGDSTDNISSYGMTVYKDHIYAGLICVPPGPFIPFTGVWSGVKSLIYSSDCALSINEDKQAAKLNIFPNPAKTEITIANTAAIDQLSIYDLTGKLILRDNSGVNNVLIGSLSSGIYLIQIKSEGNTIEQKLIIE